MDLLKKNVKTLRITLVKINEKEKIIYDNRIR